MSLEMIVGKKHSSKICDNIWSPN